MACSHLSTLLTGAHLQDESEIDWDMLLQEKANFVPVLEDELDTSYFDSRQDRYEYHLRFVPQWIFRM